jgi:hypothetical protein
MYAPGGEHVDDESTATTTDRAARVHVDFGAGLALFVAGAAILVLGVLPDWTLDIAHQATQLLAAR